MGGDGRHGHVALRLRAARTSQSPRRGRPNDLRCAFARPLRNATIGAHGISGSRRTRIGSSSFVGTRTSIPSRLRRSSSISDRGEFDRSGNRRRSEAPGSEFKLRAGRQQRPRGVRVGRAIPNDPARGRWIIWRAICRSGTAIPFSQLPRVAPSRTAIVWTANNKMYGPRYPFELSPQFAPPYRAYRIAELLRARRVYDVAYFASMQMDTLSLAERELAHDLAPALGKSDAGTAAALARWDGEVDGDSTTATVVEGLRLLLTDHHTGRMPTLLSAGVTGDGLRAIAPPSPAPWRIAGRRPGAQLAVIARHQLSRRDYFCPETETRSRCTCNIRTTLKASAQSGTWATGTRVELPYRRVSRASPARDITPTKPMRGSRDGFGRFRSAMRPCSALPRIGRRCFRKSGDDSFGESGRGPTNREAHGPTRLRRGGTDDRRSIPLSRAGARSFRSARGRSRCRLGGGLRAGSVRRRRRRVPRGLVVDEAIRGAGIGAQLLAAAEVWARERGCTEMRVHSNVVRNRATNSTGALATRRSSRSFTFVNRSSVEPSYFCGG